MLSQKLAFTLAIFLFSMVMPLLALPKIQNEAKILQIRENTPGVPLQPACQKKSGC